MNCRFGAIAGSAALAALLWAGAGAIVATEQTAPTFEVDASSAKPLSNDWKLGSVAAVAVDSRDHVWILQNPTGPFPQGDPTPSAVFGSSGFQEPPSLTDILAAGKKPAPPVIEFDAEGNVVQGWGGPGNGYPWMERSTALFPVGSPAEHGLFVDHKDNVWVTGNGHVALKFTREGKFLLQIGELGKTGGSSDTKLLGNPTGLTVDPKTNEVYIADGYLNRRVIVFDADTGAYKRHWGAYGKPPTDGPASKRFDPNGPLPQEFLAVHCVHIANDGLVYVCDRQRNRIQVFKTDGTFVTEVLVAKDTLTTGPPYGSVNDVAFSRDPQQEFLFVGDGTNSKIWILRRSTLEVLGSHASYEGNHFLAVDSRGHLYTVGSRGNRGTAPRRLASKGAVDGDRR